MSKPNVIELRPNRAQRRRALRPPAAPTPVSEDPVHSAAAVTLADCAAPQAIDRELLNQALMLDWLGQRPVSFHRSYVDLTGSVVAAVWLSYAMDRMAGAERGALDEHGDFRFEMTAQECEQGTGITRAQQATCRRLLSQRGLLTEYRQRGRIAHYRIHVERLAQCLLHQAAPLAARLAQSRDEAQLDFGPGVGRTQSA